MAEMLDYFWGKWDEKKGTFHPLICHSLDVAAVVYELLNETLLSKRLATLGKLEKLHDAQIDALCFFAVMHDFGKASILFQLRPFPAKKRPKNAGSTTGHVQPALELLGTRGFSLQEEFIALFPKHLAPIGTGVDPLGPLRALLVCTICHHGLPWMASHESPTDACWQPHDGLDPFSEVRRLIDSGMTLFPLVNTNEAELPFNPEFLHSWNGILTLADWIGSSEIFFPHAGNTADLEQLKSYFQTSRSQAQEALLEIGLSVKPSRKSLKRRPTFSDISKHPQPRPAQKAIAELTPSSEGSTVVLEAATGSGKTEAALLHFARLFQSGEVDGFYFALPTRSAATQIQRRMEETIRDCLFSHLENRPAVIQAVPGYLRADAEEGSWISKFEVEWSEDSTKQERLAKRSWAAESSKSYTAGAFVVGTIDQILLSVLRVKHAHLRQAGLFRHLLIVDEVHASDTYMGRILEQVLTCHRAAGGHAMLMSATLGSEARYRFLHPGCRNRQAERPLDEALAVPYPMIQIQNGNQEAEPPQKIGRFQGTKSQVKTVELDPLGQGLIDDPQAIADLALKAALLGAKVLVIRNTVKDCRATQEELERLASEAGRTELLFGIAQEGSAPRIFAPHHGRFDPAARKALDQAVEKFFHPEPAHRPEAGCVAVATQTVEQSLDIDADFLITDLCPMDVLLQRLGRLHRRHGLPRPKGFERTRIVVLTPEQELSGLMIEDGSTRGIHGLGGLVYSDLRILEATRRELNKPCRNRRLELPIDCRALVEMSTHHSILRAIGKQEPKLEQHWKNHSRSILGQQLQKRLLARNALIPWEATFGDFVFDRDLDRAIQTRLGVRDILVSFPEETPGPFGHPLTQLAIHPYELGNEEIELDKEAVAEDVVVKPGQVRFTFAGTGFVYDRTGISQK